MRQKALVGTGLALALVAATPAAALASSSNGARSLDFHKCVTNQGTTFCLDSTGQTNTTTTPSGNTSVEAHFTASETVTSPLGTTTNTADVNQHSLTKQGQPQEFSLHETNPLTSLDGSTCTATYDVHYANGQYQFDNLTTTC